MYLILMTCTLPTLAVDEEELHPVQLAILSLLQQISHWSFSTGPIIMNVWTLLVFGLNLEYIFLNPFEKPFFPVPNQNVWQVHQLKLSSLKVAPLNLSYMYLLPISLYPIWHLCGLSASSIIFTIVQCPSPQHKNLIWAHLAITTRFWWIQTSCKRILPIINLSLICFCIHLQAIISLSLSLISLLVMIILFMKGILKVFQISNPQPNITGHSSPLSCLHNGNSGPNFFVNSFYRLIQSSSKTLLAHGFINALMPGGILKIN